MLNCNDEAEEDIFFDSLSSSEGSVSGNNISELDYEIWRNEPGSIQERRDRFIRGMGFTEFVPLKSSCSQEIQRDLERVADCSVAVSSSLGSIRNGEEEEEHSVYRKDPADVQMRFVSGEPAQCGSDGRTMMVHEFKTENGSSPLAQQLEQREVSAHGEKDHHLCGKKICSWWNRLLCRRMKKRMAKNCETPKINKMKVEHNKKRCMEFTAVYMGQEIQAHKGFIWTMKFSPDGQYLASGGEDGVVRIWRVTSIDASCKSFSAEGNAEFIHKAKGSKLILRRKNSRPASVVIPQKVFKIEESPLQEFHGHTSYVLDLCWSKSNCLLSSSKDKTVRLWQVGFDDCIQVFYHNNYVTCIQFNPIDDGYFISGSIDGKVRIWRVAESRVVDWADARDIVTAICYQPDGKGFVVGSISGHCRFYGVSGNQLLLDAQISVRGRKKSSTNRITGFQFSPENSQRVMITSADSKVRIVDGVDVVHKYRGLRKSGNQMSASFTSNGRYIISVGQDSRVYVWNYDGLHCQSPRHAKSIRSCEHFCFEGVSVAIPWSEIEPEQMSLHRDHLASSLQTPKHLDGTFLLLKDSDRFCLSGWFAMDERSKVSATWPEEKLPLWAAPVAEHDNYDIQDHGQQQQYDNHNHRALSSSWGLVIVTAGGDGMIRTFHNYGLPIRL